MNRFLLLCALGFGAVSSFAQGFGSSELVQDWQFHLGDEVERSTGELNRGDWRAVTVPHDWSVELPASPEKASCTGYLPGGIGWYRTELNIPAAERAKRYYLYFEGVYNRSEVFVNGTSVGVRPNGYVSFSYDITDQVTPGEKNIVTVRVDHSRDADSRWYTGSGIYRPVHLITANPVHIDLWGVYSVAKINGTGAVVGVETALVNETKREATLVVEQTLMAPDGSAVSDTRGTTTVAVGQTTTYRQQLTLEQALRWSVKNPNLYTLHTTVKQDGKTIDSSSHRIGIRALSFDPDKGFALNGEWMKVKGVCLHHDAGVLGAAVPNVVWRERLLSLKKIGCNAIRMSHNPQATALYDLCDELGFLVMDEAFDEWEYEKKKWIKGWNNGAPGFQGSADFFEEWAERDLADMVKRDRNHPSIMMWSIGNEVDYPNDPYSHPVLDGGKVGQKVYGGYSPSQPPAERLGAIAKRLAAVVRELDCSRPVTAALAGAVMSNETDYPGALDIVGYNYTEFRYDEDHKTYPKRVFYGSETRHDFDAWKSVADNDFIFGQFIWTGFDYLGESGAWPSRGFTTGMVDLSNNIKPRGYFRRALWADEPLAYLGTTRWFGGLTMDAGQSWNYRKGTRVRAICYTNGDEAELFLDGKSIGERKPYDTTSGIIFWDIDYAPGELKVVAYRKGKVIAEDSIKPSGEATSIRAEAKGSALFGKYGTAIILLEIVDAEGELVYDARNEITCTVSGGGKLLGIENASRNAGENFRDNKAPCKHGRLTVYIQSTAAEGEISVTFEAPELLPAALTLNVGK